MGKASKGSWDFEAIRAECLELEMTSGQNDDPVSQKILDGLTRGVDYDLYPFVQEQIISTNGLVTKSKAMAFLAWLIKDKNAWRADPDKVLSLRRIRVVKFIEMTNTYSQLADIDMFNVSFIMAKVESNIYWHLTKRDFNDATMYVASKSKSAYFQVLWAFIKMQENDFDVAAALRSCIIYMKQTDEMRSPTSQLSLF